MKHLKIILLLAIFNMSSSCAQQIEKVYLNDDDTTLNRYLAIIPDDKDFKAFMFLVPSFGETPEEVLKETDLPGVAAKRGILTIIPTFKTGTMSAGIDPLTQQSFRELVNNVAESYNLAGKKLFVGGFSIGGTAAVKFAELANQENYNFKSTAVFAIDPPLDFERLYNSSKRAVRLSGNSEPRSESVYLIRRIEQEMNGSPEVALQNYHQLSPYSFSDTSQTAIKNLLNTPIRIYSEPDIDFFLSKGIDLFSINAFDASAMINELNRLGNSKAYLIVTKDKGYRKPGNTKNPHSWSIAEPSELIDWLLEQ